MRNAAALPEKTFEICNIPDADFVMPNCDIAVSSHFLYPFSGKRPGISLITLYPHYHG